MTKEEIALQLTLSKISYIVRDESYPKTEENAQADDAKLAKAVADFYNVVYSNLDIEEPLK